MNVKFCVILNNMTDKKPLNLTRKLGGAKPLSLGGTKKPSSLSLNKSKPIAKPSLSINKAKPIAKPSLSLNKGKPIAKPSLSLNKSKPAATGSLSLNRKPAATGSLSLNRKPAAMGSLSLNRKAASGDSDGSGLAPKRTLRGKRRIVVNTQAKRRPPPKKKKKKQPPPPPKKNKLPPQKQKKPVIPPQVKRPPPREEDIQTLDAAMNKEFEVWRLNRPLIAGIKRRLKKMIKSKNYEPLPCFPRQVIQVLMRRHARSIEYLTNVVEGTHRYNLDNEAVTEIQDNEREFSRHYLEELQKELSDGKAHTTLGFSEPTEDYELLRQEKKLRQKEYRKKKQRLKRLEEEKLEQERLEQEKLEKEKLEQERLEQEKLEKERLKTGPNTLRLKSNTLKLKPSTLNKNKTAK